MLKPTNAKQIMATSFVITPLVGNQPPPASFLRPIVHPTPVPLGEDVSAFAKRSLPHSLRKLVACMLRATQSDAPTGGKNTYRPLLHDATRRRVVATVVVLLERMGPGTPNPYRSDGGPPELPWNDSLLLMVAIHSVLRLADENGGMRHTAALVPLLHALHPSALALGRAGTFIHRQEARFLHDIQFAAYVNLNELKAAEKKLTLWARDASLCTFGSREDDDAAARMASMLASLIHRGARGMLLAHPARDVPCALSSLGLPLTPHLVPVPPTPVARHPGQARGPSPDQDHFARRPAPLPLAVRAMDIDNAFSTLQGAP